MLWRGDDPGRDLQASAAQPESSDRNEHGLEGFLTTLEILDPLRDEIFARQFSVVHEFIVRATRSPAGGPRPRVTKFV